MKFTIAKHLTPEALEKRILRRFKHLMPTAWEGKSFCLLQHNGQECANSHLLDKALKKTDCDDVLVIAAYGLTLEAHQLLDEKCRDRTLVLLLLSQHFAWHDRQPDEAAYQKNRR